MKLFEKYRNRNLAKQEHNYRMGDPMHNLGFNEIVKQIQEINKQALLHNLMEAGGVSPENTAAIHNLETAIEEGRKNGLLTELYTRPTEN